MKEFCWDLQTSFRMYFPRPGHPTQCVISFDVSPEIAMAGDDSHGGATPSDPNDYDDPDANKGRMKELLEYYDLLLCNGSMTETTKRVIYEGLAGTPGDGPSQADKRIKAMLLAIITSADCAVEE